MRSFSSALAALALCAMPFTASAQDASDTEAAPPVIGVMSTIPLFWGEPTGHDDAFLRSDMRLHWAKPLLEERYTLRALDYLSDEAFATLDGLLLAQPRGLTGEENVALDTYVRGGGRVLLLADPMMTGESVYHIGDRRRPQDVALLSPILGRWGLELRFDESQAEGIAERAFDGTTVPVNLAGEFIAMGDDCTVSADGYAARCRVGEGEVLALADAAILDLYGPWEGAEAGLLALAESIFPEFGDGAGNDPSIPLSVGNNSGNTDAERAPHTRVVTMTGEDSVK